jgi:precorrin-6A/cobalt-precorrin-6A reductase
VIFLEGGTADGREAAERLAAAGEEVIYSSISNYNAPKENRHLHWHIGTMDADQLKDFLTEQKVTVFVDATHPYARQASVNAMAACGALHLRYIRFERPGILSMAPELQKQVRHFPDYDEMVSYLQNFPGNILTTTGSRELAHYQTLDKERLFIRVLPTSSVLKKCEGLGYKPSHIFGMQGPFSQAMNAAMIEDHEIRFVTTKDSGDIGGVADKIRAAKEKGAEVLCVDRPDLDYPEVYADIDRLLGQLAARKDDTQG